MGIAPAFAGGRLVKPLGGGSDTADPAADGGTAPADGGGGGPGAALAVPLTGAAGLGLAAG